MGAAIRSRARFGAGDGHSLGPRGARYPGRRAPRDSPQVRLEEQQGLLPQTRLPRVVGNGGLFEFA